MTRPTLYHCTRARSMRAPWTLYELGTGHEPVPFTHIALPTKRQGWELGVRGTLHKTKSTLKTDTD